MRSQNSSDALSALLDGECDAAETDRLLAELARSPELRSEWSRMCLAREAAGGTRIGRDQPCICAGVMAGLDDAPAANVVPFPSRRKPYNWQSWPNLAAAAALAAVAVLVAMPTAHDDSANPAAMPVLQAALTPSVGKATTLVAAAPSRRARALQVAAVRAPEEQQQQDELDAMLMEHSNSIADQGMGRTLRYARFAAHTAEYRPGADDSQEQVGEFR